MDNGLPVLVVSCRPENRKMLMRVFEGATHRWLLRAGNPASQGSFTVETIFAGVLRGEAAGRPVP